MYRGVAFAAWLGKMPELALQLPSTVTSTVPDALYLVCGTAR